MNSFVDEVLTGDPKYTLTYNDNTQATNVSIALSTPVQTQGTALNKAFFDSIQTDLTNLNNNKLNVSNKASSAEINQGTNDTKYVTPLGLTTRLKKFTVSGSSTTTTAPPKYADILDLTQYTNGETLLITGALYRRYTADSDFVYLRIYHGSTYQQIARTPAQREWIWLLFYVY